jgi:hypothetical protein
MISKCFFGADFAKCKKIFANCMKVIPEKCRAHWIIYLRIYFKPTTLLDVVAIILLYQWTKTEGIDKIAN